MNEQFIPAEAFPVGEYLEDELKARGWTTRDCAERMCGNVDIDQLTLDLCIALAHDSANYRCVMMGAETARGLEIALGTSAETWLNLDRAYHEWRKRR